MAPKTKHQFEVMRTQRIASIKEAALELFATHGYAHTSIAQIAKEAGISKGLMYNYFDGKEGLLRSIVSEAIVSGETMIKKGIHTSEDPLEQLTGLIKMTFQSVRKNLQYWKLITSLAFQKQVLQNIEDIIGPKNIENMAIVVPILKQLGYEEPEKEALFLGAALDGIMMGFLSIGESYPIAEMEQYLIDRIAKHSTQKPGNKPIEK